jgi:hypothetical protein
MTQRMYMVERESLSTEGRSCEKFAVVSADATWLMAARLYRKHLCMSREARAHQTVHIRDKPSCDCPDFVRGNRPCKHVIFV